MVVSVETTSQNYISIFYAIMQPALRFCASQYALTK